MNIKQKAVRVFIVIVAIALYFSSCNTIKKSLTKDIHKSDSTIVEKKHETTATETAQKSDVVTNETTTTESNYEVVAVDSGNSVVVSDGSEYLTVETKKPTKFILPKKSEKKVSTTQDHSSSQKKEVAAKTEQKNVAVKTVDVVVKKDVKKTRLPIWVGIVPLLLFVAWYLNKKYKLLDRVKAFILTVIPL